MGLIGGLNSVDQVSARRPMLVLAAGLAQAATAYGACAAVADHAPVAVTSFSPSAQLPDGLVRIGLWVAWTLTVSLWLFITPGRLKFPAADRHRLDDELVTHHRATAIKAGYAVLAALVMLAAIAAAGGQVAGWWPIAALAASLCMAAVVFAVLELRADA